MSPQNGVSPIDLTVFPHLSHVLDLVYNPIRTALVLQARRLGVAASGGLAMLVAQAVHAAARFTGEPPRLTYVPELTLGLLRQRLNLVLIGMPGCGKTAVGRIVAARTGRTFVDLDEWVEKEAGQSIPEIFAEKGEETFRALESRAAVEVGKGLGLVISTGGGTLLRKDNIDALQQNGLLIWLRRPLKTLSTEGRPLSVDRAALEMLYEKRASIYQNACDHEIDNEGDLEEVAQAVWRAFDETACD